MKPALSLKGRALQCVAQREHSRAELRRKLLAHARAGAPDAEATAADATAADNTAVDAIAVDAIAVDTTTEVDAVLDWMQAGAYLSDERFVESLVHARVSRFGNLRIRGELAQHGVTLPPELADALRHTEKSRAYEVWQRKFSQAPAGAAERARQMRFLAGRGFSAEVIGQVLRQVTHEVVHERE